MKNADVNEDTLLSKDHHDDKHGKSVCIDLNSEEISYF